MNIHLPAILGFTRYQGFDPSPYCLVSLVYPKQIFGIIPRTVHFGYYELSHFRTRGRYRRSLLDEGWMLTPGSLPSRLRGVPHQIMQVLIRGWHSCANMECSVTLGWSPYEIHHLVWGCFEEIVIYTYPLPVRCENLNNLNGHLRFFLGSCLLLQ